MVNRRLTIVMPAYNEEACIERSVREALEALDELSDGSAEVLVLDDGSTDATPEILDRLGQQDDRLRVVRQDPNRGIGWYERAMLSEARGEWVFFTGADGEWDPRESLRFVDLAESEGLDAVLGYRTEKHYTAWRKLVSWVFNASLRWFFGARFRDVGSIRLLRRALFEPLTLYSNSAFLNAERLLVARRKGASIKEVPVEHRERFAGRGGGAKLGAIREALADLVGTRLRWFRFESYYS